MSIPRRLAVVVALLLQASLAFGQPGPLELAAQVRELNKLKLSAIIDGEPIDFVHYRQEYARLYGDISDLDAEERASVISAFDDDMDYEHVVDRGLRLIIANHVNFADLELHDYVARAYAEVGDPGSADMLRRIQRGFVDAIAASADGTSPAAALVMLSRKEMRDYIAARGWESHDYEDLETPSGRVTKAIVRDGATGGTKVLFFRIPTPLSDTPHEAWPPVPRFFADYRERAELALAGAEIDFARLRRDFNLLFGSRVHEEAWRTANAHFNGRDYFNAWRFAAFALEKNYVHIGAHSLLSAAAMKLDDPELAQVHARIADALAASITGSGSGDRSSPLVVHSNFEFHDYLEFAKLELVSLDVVAGNEGGPLHSETVLALVKSKETGESRSLYILHDRLFDPEDLAARNPMIVILEAPLPRVFVHLNRQNGLAAIRKGMSMLGYGDQLDARVTDFRYEDFYEDAESAVIRFTTRDIEHGGMRCEGGVLAYFHRPLDGFWYLAGFDFTWLSSDADGRRACFRGEDGAFSVYVDIE
jgi:hypothetical protein